MHSIDSQYQSQVFRSVNTLLQGAGGVFSRIPETYARHLAHDYSDGDISLLSKIHTFEYSELEPWQVDEVLHDLSKVSPEEWAELDYIESIDLDAYYNRDVIDDAMASDGHTHETSHDYGEKTDLEYGDKVHRLLKHAIEHAYGQPIGGVYSSGKKPPCKNNGYCRKNNKYVGQFDHDGKTFDFELTPDEMGEWHVAYSLDKASKDKLFKPDTSKTGSKGGKK